MWSYWRLMACTKDEKYAKKYHRVKLYGYGFLFISESNHMIMQRLCHNVICCEYEIDTAGGTIEDGSTTNTIFKILGNKYSRKILESLIDSPKPALDISKECKISLTLAYKKIKNLKI